MTQQPTIYALYDTETKQFIVCGTKCGWATAGAAKLACGAHIGKPWKYGGGHKFAEQDKVVVMEIKPQGE